MSIILFGSYVCVRCAKTYLVNDEWGPCTPEFCHACTKHLESLHALVPVDENGEELKH